MAAAACEAVRVKRSFYDADPEANEFSLSKRCRPLLPVSANKGPLHHRGRHKVNLKSPFAAAGADFDGAGPAESAYGGGGGAGGMDVERFGGGKRRRKGGGGRGGMGDMSASPKAEASPQAAYSMAADSPRSEEPIMFTMKQVKSIVQSALDEREAELVAQYDAILAERLTDQFNVFSKFNQDHIHATFSKYDECSYMS
eukprot:m.35265 g.35265  ORF g.35265 m.35265 type:complete len:199 (+) comp12754_c0_seq1:61-657(+)